MVPDGHQKGSTLNLSYFKVITVVAIWSQEHAGKASQRWTPPSQYHTHSRGHPPTEEVSRVGVPSRASHRARAASPVGQVRGRRADAGAEWGASSGVGNLDDAPAEDSTSSSNSTATMAVWPWRSPAHPLP
jgi:hypothetical protein